MTDSSLVYDHVERQLANADVESSAAEVHGVLCGLLCSGCKDAMSRWYLEVLPEARENNLLARECESSLRSLYDETHEAITGPGLGFTPFLPDDALPLKQRARAVSDWSQGFLYGVGLSGLASRRELAAEAREALHDFGEITRMDLDQLSEDEDNEAALVELTEFLWVAAMLVHADMVDNNNAVET